MLEGIGSADIIVGAYTTSEGICPMLAAHRAGGRTSLISFARAWDRFTLGRERRAKPRRASERELLILRTHLEASLLDETGPLSQAIAEHQALAAATRAMRRSAPRAGDADRSKELRTRPGWAWMRIFRRYDDYRRALDRLHDEAREHELA